MDYTTRRATLQDAPLIAHQRRLMFDETKSHPESALDQMETAYTIWVAQKLATSEYFGWFADAPTGETAAGVGLWLREWPPILYDPTGKQGYVENVFTLPDHRRRGLARRLMVEMIEWARTSGAVYNMALHATSIAQPLYQSLGFATDSGLMLYWTGPKR